ncbi:hypothetical protein Tco_0877532 [Tanacetum coccineum]|uniref:Uncharacterized protein n=1 Tax=Tanacetum coccineum TaxID=301880 RepID=A0ABQ5BY21_9ASTR
MSFITAQQTKLGLELVPKEKSLRLKMQRKTQSWKETERTYISSCPGCIALHITYSSTIGNFCNSQQTKVQSRKTTGLDKFRLSKAQILWGMYYKMNVDYVELLWEDFTYQIDNKAHKKQEKMYYPQITPKLSYYNLTKTRQSPGETR